MARGIISCTGEMFNIGDKVKTADGTIVRVEGAAIGAVFHNAELCTKVHPDTPTTAEHNAKHGHKDDASRAGRASDCIIWGT